MIFYVQCQSYFDEVDHFHVSIQRIDLAELAKEEKIK